MPARCCQLDQMRLCWAGIIRPPARLVGTEAHLGTLIIFDSRAQSCRLPADRDPRRYSAAYAATPAFELFAIRKLLRFSIAFSIEHPLRAGGHGCVSPAGDDITAQYHREDRRRVGPMQILPPPLPRRLAACQNVLVPAFNGQRDRIRASTAAPLQTLILGVFLWTMQYHGQFPRVPRCGSAMKPCEKHWPGLGEDDTASWTGWTKRGSRRPRTPESCVVACCEQYD